MAKTNPELIINEIQDLYLRRNFSQLDNYFKTQNQLLDFKFFEVKFTATTLNQKVNHGLKFIPKDVVFLGATNNATVSFNIGNFTLQSMDISSNKETTLRFFIGKYFNDQSNAQYNKDDVLVFGPDQSVSGEASSKNGYLSIKSDYVFSDDNSFIDVNASSSIVNITINPSVSRPVSTTVVIRKSDSSTNAVVIRGQIDFQLKSQNDSVVLFYNGTSWVVEIKNIKPLTYKGISTANITLSTTMSAWSYTGVSAFLPEAGVYNIFFDGMFTVVAGTGSAVILGGISLSSSAGVGIIQEVQVATGAIAAGQQGSAYAYGLEVSGPSVVYFQIKPIQWTGGATLAGINLRGDVVVSTITAQKIG